jgi:hypothetical protein
LMVLSNYLSLAKLNRQREPVQVDLMQRLVVALYCSAE